MGNRAAATANEADIKQQEVELSAALFKAYQEWRREKGLPVPSMDKELSKLAYKAAANCAMLGEIKHRTSMQQDPPVRLSDIIQYTAWKADPADVVSRWASSAGHRYQMQCTSTERAGAGAYRDGNGTWWYAIVYDFGTRNQTDDAAVRRIAEHTGAGAGAGVDAGKESGVRKYSPTGVF